MLVEVENNLAKSDYVDGERWSGGFKKLPVVNHKLAGQHTDEPAS